MTAPETGSEISADTLVDAGAAPVEVDVATLMAQMEAMQRRMDELQAAQPKPADATAAAVKDLRDHVLSRLDAVPARAEELKELRDLVKDLPDKPDRDQTDLVRTVLSEIRSHLEGLDYLHELANSLHKRVLKG